MDIEFYPYSFQTDTTVRPIFGMFIPVSMVAHTSHRGSNVHAALEGLVIK